MISQTAEYALRAVIHLATQPNVAQTAQQIAEATKVSPGYLSKVLQSLARGGIVRSQRGLHGGFVLDREPAGLSIYDVISAVEPIQRINTCPLGLSQHGTRLCNLHRRLDDAMRHAEEAFRQTMVQELLDAPNPSRPLCS